MASHFMGLGSVRNCRRWTMRTKDYVNTPRPDVVEKYNLNMGGIDKLDCMTSLYRTLNRSRKSILCMFSHAIDMTCAISKFEYKQKCSQMGMLSKGTLDFIYFRA